MSQLPGGEGGKMHLFRWFKLGQLAKLYETQSINQPIITVTICTCRKRKAAAWVKEHSASNSKQRNSVKLTSQ